MYSIYSNVVWIPVRFSYISTWASSTGMSCLHQLVLPNEGGNSLMGIRSTSITTKKHHKTMVLHHQVLIWFSWLSLFCFLKQHRLTNIDLHLSISISEGETQSDDRKSLRGNRIDWLVMFGLCHWQSGGEQLKRKLNLHVIIRSPQKTRISGQMTFHTLKSRHPPVVYICFF